MTNNSSNKINAAVVVPVYRHKSGVLRLVLIRRAFGGYHGGQLAFPGGKCESEDKDMAATALRETEEEIGIHPTKVKIIETLPCYETMTSGFRIYPFLADITPPVMWDPDQREVDEVIEVAVTDLAAPEVVGKAERVVLGGEGSDVTPFVQVGEDRLWGVSLRILNPILPRLLANEWGL